MAETKIKSEELKPTFGVVQSTGDVSLTAVSADITGATVTFTVVTPVVIVVHAIFDMDAPGNGQLAIGKINIDGSDQTPSAIFGGTGVGTGRGSAVTFIQANLAAGSHTIKLRASATSSAGIVRNPHTMFSYTLYSQ